MTVTQYEICIQEILDERFASWFAGLEICPCAVQGTLLRGPLADKAALHGLLNQMYALNLTLVSLRQLPNDAPRETPTALTPKAGK